MMAGVGFVLLVVGIGGICGAIELGTGLIASLVILTIGGLLFAVGIQKGEMYEETDEDVIYLLDHDSNERKGRKSV